MNTNSSSRNKGLHQINLTSLVDVALTLVIIFMVSFPFVMQSGIMVSSPSLKKANTSKEISDIKAEIHLKADSTIELNGKSIAPGLFSDSLRTLFASSSNKLAVISADKNVVHDRVIAILDEAKQSGAEKLSI
ncbi:ExbD/TolR family protein, partial [Streptococcus pseudopneumoniae]|uniref:ExbD/TolR family protein n=1 Tax=Streptococcus pseudopneumoniae TaxID=257758 RepID=UPI00110C3450